MSTVATTIIKGVSAQTWALHDEWTCPAEICNGISRQKLDSPITDLHIAELASDLKSWEELVPYLHLTEAEEEEIRMNYQNRYGLQKREALRKWKQELGKRATYRALIAALCLVHQGEMAEKVKQLAIKPENPNTANHILETFREYLVDCYTETPHPSHTQWPFSQVSSYINLTLFEAPKVQYPQSSSTEKLEGRTRPQPLKEVQLGELFHVGSHRAKRKVVLVEGPAGCGKTTLSWHACRDWAAGRLFQQSSLFTHVSLEDPAVCKAECLADIIPHESSEMREAVAGAISERHGKGVCFLFDAWDEAPRTLQRKSAYLYKFITGTSTRMLPRCSIVITSRPIAAALLYPNLTAQVIVWGFNSDKVVEFIDASVGHDTDAKPKLLQALQRTPELSSLCSLPINTAIVVHIFQSLDYKLPSTCTGLFHVLVCNLLLRHMDLRTDYELQKLVSFENLPDDVLQQFKFVCAVAFHGIMEDKKVFEISSLKLQGMSHPTNSLGLMQAHQRLTCYGPSHHYSFLHYAVQEFLAAYHISKLSEEEQTSAIRKILHSTPLSLVLPFYAGLTGLATEGARDVLLKVTKSPLDRVSVFFDRSFNTFSDKRLLLLALLNCIYESQNPALCRLVNPPTNPEYLEQYFLDENLPNKSVQQSVVETFGTIFTLIHLNLTPADCLSVGYFILNFHKEIEFDLEKCCVSDAAVQSLMSQLRKPCRNEPSHITIILNHIRLTDNAVRCIGNTLSQTSVLGRLELGGCFGPNTNIRECLKYIIEGISRSPFLEYLLLNSCHLGPEHGYHLALMIAVSNLQRLSLSSNNIGSISHLIVKAVLHSTVYVLFLTECCISDRELHSIGVALQGNKSLIFLYIGKNLFSSLSLTKFLQLLIYNSGLHYLGLNHSLTNEQKDIVTEINHARQIQKVNHTEFYAVDMTSQHRKVDTFYRSVYLSRALDTELKSLC